MVETCRFVRKPLIVDAVQVTAANFEEIAEWCEGCIRWVHDGSELSTTDNPSNGTIDPSSGVDAIDPENQYISVDVINPRSQRQQKAYVDDWLLKSDSGFKIYTAKAFENSFDPLEYEEMGNPDQLTTAETTGEEG